MMRPPMHPYPQASCLLLAVVVVAFLSLTSALPFRRWGRSHATVKNAAASSNSQIILDTNDTTSPSTPVADDNHDNAVPLIDLSIPDDLLIPQIARACQSPGFFQVTNHGIDENLIASFRQQMKLYYDQPHADKIADKRSAHNARGFFDDEFTKQRRDFKQGLDIGVPGSRDWDIPDKDPRNQHCLDGLNPFPTNTNATLSNYRSVTVAYFQACEQLAQRLTMLMAKGLEWIVRQAQEQENSDTTLQSTTTISNDTSSISSNITHDAFLQDMAANHSSYLRTNYYPPTQQTQDDPTKNIPPVDADMLGISPHKDAGFLTILLQDDHCHSLQVPLASQTNNGTTTSTWTTVHPQPGALTINTGDMAQIWSNGLYQAPLHRVLTHATQPRYSAPFFYNPPYHALMAPLPQLFHQQALYHPVLWAYFRGLRFAGDWTDLGVEIQIEHFAKDAPTDYGHLDNQRAFIRRGLDGERYNVAKLQDLISRTPSKDNDKVY